MCVCRTAAEGGSVGDIACQAQLFIWRVSINNEVSLILCLPSSALYSTPKTLGNQHHAPSALLTRSTTSPRRAWNGICFARTRPASPRQRERISLSARPRGTERRTGPFLHQPQPDLPRYASGLAQTSSSTRRRVSFSKKKKSPLCLPRKCETNHTASFKSASDLREGVRTLAVHVRVYFHTEQS